LHVSARRGRGLLPPPLRGRVGEGGRAMSIPSGPPPPTPPRKGEGSSLCVRRHLAFAVSSSSHAFGIGNTGLADANAAGKITWMSLSSTCVFTGAAPWFCPLTNLVGPYGITWPLKVELSSAAVILARSALAARSS